MIDRFAAESIQFVQSLSKEAKDSGRELGEALGQILDDIPALQELLVTLKSEGSVRYRDLERHLLTLHVIYRFVEQATIAAKSVPSA